MKLEKTKEMDLLALCQLWYITRQATFGTPVLPEVAEALTAFDAKVQEVIERHQL